jgi:CubicO group peptidase (beta-lactamase class C family)
VDSTACKPILATATLLLVEDGKLKLDDPVDAWLLELSNRRVLRRVDGPLDDTVPAHRPISVDDLLTLRMGFGTLVEPTFPLGMYPIGHVPHRLLAAGRAHAQPAQLLHDQFPNRTDGAAERVYAGGVEHAAGLPVGRRRPGVDRRRLSGLRYAWANIQEEIAKSDVRCANCHRRRTALQFDWPKLRRGGACLRRKWWT